MTDRAAWQIEVSNTEDAAVTQTLREGLSRHAIAPGQPWTRHELVLTARDTDGKLLGGTTGQFAYGWLHLAMLWVHERSRGQGLGSALLVEVERQSAAADSRGVHLSTSGFQARQFYERNGYKLFGQLDDEPADRIRYFLRRTIKGAAT